MDSEVKNWVIIIFAILAIICFMLIPLYFRVSGDLRICKIYYPEMGTLECYFSSKTVRVPQKN